MCTVTLMARASGGLRLVTNRDEARTRPPGRPPRIWTSEGGVRALYPTDPVGGGTWVAAGETGLVLALLNGNPTPAPPGAEEAISRGTIVPALVSARSVAEACERLESFELARVAPFRLLIAGVGAEEVRVAAWGLGPAMMGVAGGREGVVWSRYPSGPLCLASSGLGDERVAPRLELFDQWIGRHGATAEAQDSFHRHSWPDRREISVLMSRPDARTVSTTTIEMDLARAGGVGVVARMIYRDDAGERRVELPEVGPVAAGRA